MAFTTTNLEATYALQGLSMTARLSLIPRRMRGHRPRLQSAAWRSALLGSAVLATLVSGRFAYDTFAPPSNWGPRSAFSTWSAIAVYLVVGFWAARRTRRATTGILVAVTTHVMAHAMSISVALAIFFAAIRHDPAMLVLFNQTGGWDEVWALPLMVLPVVAVLGSIGGLAGRYA
jgi:hypothetical protein